MLTLDGTHLEGGGSLVRVALALSAVTGKPFKITNIRAHRPEPGLKAQHLHAIKALTQLCQAETNPIELGTRELTFTPGKIKAGIYTIDIGTAGSVTLLLQALILPALFAPRKVTFIVRGGTCGKWQASVDYLQNILLPYLQRFVEKIELKIIKRGYFPQGGGEVKLEITPRFPLSSFPDFATWWTNVQEHCPPYLFSVQGALQQIKGVVNVFADLQEKNVAERVAKAAEDHLRQHCAVPINIRLEYASALSSGGEILLWVVYDSSDKSQRAVIGSDVLLEPNKRSEDIGREAAQKLVQEIKSGAAVDHFLADQLVQFMALLPGSALTTSNISDHTKTNCHVVEQFLPVHFTYTAETMSVAKK